MSESENVKRTSNQAAGIARFKFPMKTDTLILAKAMRMLADNFESVHGLEYLAMYEAAERLDELHEENKRLKAEIDGLKRD